MLKFDAQDNRLTMTGDVGYEDGFDADQVAEVLHGIGGEDFSFVIRSDGGVITEGLSIYNQLREYPGKIEGHVDVKAHSIASVIMLGADKLSASANASFLLHDAWTICMGSSSELREIADALDIAQDDIVAAYVDKASDRHDWRSIMRASTEYKAEQALEIGLIDEVRQLPPRKTEDEDSTLQPARLIQLQAYLKTGQTTDTPDLTLSK